MTRLSRAVWPSTSHRSSIYQLPYFVYLGVFVLSVKLCSEYFQLPKHICESSTSVDAHKDVVKAERLVVPDENNKPTHLSQKARILLLMGISEDERTLFYLLLRAFQEIAPFDLTYFMYGGTLLGSYRHHGMIPWDDDLDLLVRETDKGRLLRVLQNLKPDFIVDTQNHTLWKFFHKSSIPGRYNWGAWPFIDIFFFKENSTHIWVTSHLDKFTYSKTMVFPLIMRPFMDFMLPAPRHTKEFVEITYDIEKCSARSWSHKHQASRYPHVSTHCHKLHGVFPFVNIGNSTIELLKDDLIR